MNKSEINQKNDRLAINGTAIPPYEQPHRWIILTLVCFSYLIFGMVAFSSAPLVTPIIRDLGISYSQMGIILGGWQITYVVFSVISGVIIDKLGIRKSIFAGLIIISLSAILRYFAGGFISMFLLVALFGLGGTMISIGSPKAIATWFRGKERGMSVGIYSMGGWIGLAISFH